MIRFQDQSYKPQKDESLLDCLIRNGANPPYSCRSGLCQSCMMKSTNGSPPKDAQQGLKDVLVSQNYFLACRCVPDADMEIALPNSQQFRHQTHIIEKTFLADAILRLRLALPDKFEYQSGQYLSIFKNESQCRSYSIASVFDSDTFLEFHIRVLKDGLLSHWIANELKAEFPITISNAIGTCVYVDTDKDQTITLIGTGTGLAPLYGIVRTAILAGHQGELNIYHGAHDRKDLYMHTALKQLAKDHYNVNYVPCVSGKLTEATETDIQHGRCSDIALEQIKDFKGHRVYLCGNPNMVNTTKRNIFMAGASLSNIHSDAFVHS